MLNADLILSDDVCLFCEEPFEQRPSRWGSAKFCSNACRSTARALNRDLLRPQPPCVACGRDILDPQLRKYCGRTCSNRVFYERRCTDDRDFNAANRRKREKRRVAVGGMLNCSDCGKRLKSNVTARRCYSCGVAYRSVKAKAETRRRRAQMKLAAAAEGTRARDFIVYGPCTICGIEFTARKFYVHGGHLCSGKCKKRYTKRRHAERQRQRIIERDGVNCWLCEAPVDFTADPHNDWAPEIDHILPYSRGGSDDIENLKLAHRSCNITKSDKIGEELEVCLRHLRTTLTL